MQKTEIGVMLIGVKDLSKAKPFYEKVFGIEVVDFRPPFMEGKLGDVEFNIEENADYRIEGWAKHNIGTRKSFTFQVDDIFEFIKNAKEAGASVVIEPVKQHWGQYEAVIADPDMNEFIIEQEIGGEQN